jgi:putative flippase GtrA
VISPQSRPTRNHEVAGAWPQDLPHRWMRLARLHREQILYLVVGGWNTLFGYAVWALLEYLLHDSLHYLLILVLSWPVAVLNAYVCYRVFVFRSRGSIWRELPRFTLVYAVSLALSLVALPILLRTLPFSIYVIAAGFTAVMVVATYVSHKFFSFGGRRTRRFAPRERERA